jgi:outer membrane protein assembly factor BamB
MMAIEAEPIGSLAVVPVLVGPLQVLLAILPALLLSLLTAVVALFKPSTFKKGVKLLWRLKLSVLVLAAMVAGAVFGLRAALAGRGAAVAEAEAVAYDWPMFRGNIQRSGAAPGTAAPTRGGLNWSFTAEKTFYSTPTVVGNRVYVTSAEVGVFADRGAIYCLDADTGGVVWRSVPRGYRATFSSPSVAGNRLVVGEGLHLTRDARVVCLDLDRNGAVLWEYRTASHVESSPLIHNGRVYVGAGDDGYYCLDLEPDADGNARVIWHAAGDQYLDAESSPVGHGDRIYVGLGLDGHAVVCLDAAGGQELWRMPTPYPVFAPPAIARGKLFVGMGNGNMIETAEAFRERELRRLRQQGLTEEELDEARQRLAPAGEVWCLDLETGAVDWKFKLPRTVLGAIVAGEDRLFFASRDGRVYSLGYDGRPIHQWNSGAPIVTSPALADGYLYVVSDSGRLYALESRTLQPVWETILGTRGPFVGSPTIARGRAYVGTPNDGLLCLGAPADATAPPVWAGFLAGPGRAGSLELEPLPDRGALLWRYPRGEDEPQPPLQVRAPAAALGELIVVPIADGPRRGLVALQNDPRARTAWLERWFYQTDRGVHLSPAMNATRVIFVVGAPGETGRRLVCVDAHSGAERWQRPLADGVAGELFMGPDFVLVEESPGELTMLDLDGAQRWRQPTGPMRFSAACQDAIIVAAIQSPPALVALDRYTGALLWRTELEAPARAGPAVQRNTIWLGTERGIAAHRLVDGTRLWESAGGGPQGAFALGEDFIVHVTATGELVLTDRADGSLRRSVAGARADVPPALARDAVLYASGENLMKLKLDETEPVRWMTIGWLGELTTPLIVADGSVYFATDQRGFIRAARLR